MRVTAAKSNVATKNPAANPAPNFKSCATHHINTANPRIPKALPSQLCKGNAVCVDLKICEGGWVRNACNGGQAKANNNQMPANNPCIAGITPAAGKSVPSNPPSPRIMSDCAPQPISVPDTEPNRPTIKNSPSRIVVTLRWVAPKQRITAMLCRWRWLKRLAASATATAAIKTASIATSAKNCCARSSDRRISGRPDSTETIF